MHFQFEQSVAIVQNWGAPQILLILFIILLLFGAKKLPELARGMGKALREFKSATKDIEDDIRSAFDHDAQNPRESAKPVPPKPVEQEKKETTSKDASSAA